MVLEIVAFIIAVLLLLSRFLQAAKPLWNRLPQWLAVGIPAVVSLIPQVVDLLQRTKTWQDLFTYLIASVGIVIVGLFPSHGDAAPMPPVQPPKI